MSEEKKFRLVTRSDFDGLVCAVLLKELDMIDEILFVHPKDMQDGKIEITENDITTNLPFVEGCHLSFDHHESETIRIAGGGTNRIIDPKAPSAARVVFDYFGGSMTFTRVSSEMMEAVDKSDSARFTKDEILRPRDWVLLNFLMDARTGLGRFREFRISNYQLMMKLIDACREQDITEILQSPDVQERVELYFEQEERFKAQLQRCAEVHQEVVVIDLRDEDPIFAGNRFMVYALFPQCKISIHVLWGLKRQNTVFAIGKSIIDRSSNVNIGQLALEYGGGGHANAGTCQLPNDQAEETERELIERILGAEPDFLVPADLHRTASGAS